MNFHSLTPAHIAGAPHSAAHKTPAPADSPWTVRRVLLDPWVIAVGGLAAVFLAVPNADWLTHGFRTAITDYYSTTLLLCIAAVAVLHTARGAETQRERVFWGLLGLALTTWIAGETFALFFLDAENATAGIVVDLLYLCLYLGCMLALDIQPQSTHDSLQIRPLRVLASVGRVLFAASLFLYLVVLPRTLGLDGYLTWIPSFSFYVILDLYLVVRFLYASWQTRDVLWRSIFALLAGGFAFVVITDSMDLAWIANSFPNNPPRIVDLFWYLPMILVVMASRLGLNSTADSDTETIDDDERFRGVPLLVYSLAFALIHLFISLFQHERGVLEDGRVALVMTCLVVFGVLNMVQHSVINRRSRLQSLRRKEAEAHIRFLSLQDPLTGLLNRRALDKEFARAVARADRTGMGLGLMFIDLDHFKTVNDTYGHRAGDTVLREVAARITALTREIDTLARYGGDEFVLIFEALENTADAEVVARRILDGFEMGFQFESGRIQLSASIGIAIHPANGKTPSQLFESADRAMYLVKESGGAGVEFA